MIGQGSFAKVYLGKKKENNTNYAIKAFSKEFIWTQKHGMKALANEIKIMKELKNEYVIAFYDYFYYEGHNLCILMELCEVNIFINVL